MHLLRRIAVSNGNKQRKEKSTEAITEKNQETVVSWNETLEDEVWQKIVAALAARGLAAAKKDSAEKNCNQ
ncbi:MAG: hypothetical protein JW953_08830 [Anaerolineae bacterium]|nr:hypothetical protein [Anaerolineae bacterium]